MTFPLQFGIDTFGDITVDAAGQPLSHAQVLRNVLAEGIRADEVGIDFIGIGEHHREDFAVSAPEVLLAAIAARTERIRLGSAVTVLSSDDPVRVYQRFATLDAISNGRAEVILGRGSFTESFPLFGYPLNQYEQLFEEKLELFTRLRSEQAVTWSGRTRAALANQHVYPHAHSVPIPTWIGVGGSPESVIRAAHHRLPLMLAVIGGDPRRFVPYVQLFQRALRQANAPLLPIGLHSPGFIAATDAEAERLMWPAFKAMRDRIGAERGWPPMQRGEFEQEVAHGSLYVGSPETVARKMAATISSLGISRFDLKYSAGTLPHERLMECITLLGTEVVPRVKAILAQSAAA